MTPEEAIIGGTGRNDSAHQTTPDKSAPAIVDLEKLADKVSRLMRDELRLEVARVQKPVRPRTR